MIDALHLISIAESSEIIKPRKRRSISEMDRRSRKHIETKMVLLQSLGNAGKKRSLGHIKSYMEPNAGSSVWRRAAAHSLRHFDCDEVSLKLLSYYLFGGSAIDRRMTV